MLRDSEGLLVRLRPNPETLITVNTLKPCCQRKLSRATEKLEIKTLLKEQQQIHRRVDNCEEPLKHGGLNFALMAMARSTNLRATPSTMCWSLITRFRDLAAGVGAARAQDNPPSPHADRDAFRQQLRD
jgi:hypothetical protein